ncbi:MAG: hypothetical protein JWM20_285 [Patescibacteria group bacterium]|nr:hypothetical protein [Patescibacteria group bacterium]
MDNFWQNFITYIGSLVVIMPAFVWLIKKIADHFFSNKLEQYRASLEKENEKFRITYEKLHAERADVIKNIYKKIATTHDSLLSVTSPLQLNGEDPISAKRAVFVKNANDLLVYFDENKIFFSKSLESKIDSLNTDFKLVWNKWASSQGGYTGNGHDIDKWHEAWAHAKNESSKVRVEIEDEFRQLIGIE